MAVPGFDMRRQINDRYAVNSKNEIIDTLTGQNTGVILNGSNYQQILNNTFNPNPLVIGQNFTMPDADGSGGGGGGNPPNPGNGQLGTLWSKLKSAKLPNLKDMNAARANFVNKPILGGASISNIANVGGGIYHGVGALQGLTSNADAQKDLKSLENDINSLIVTNPMYDMYLDPSDEKLIRQLKNGTLQNNGTNVGDSIISSIPKALLNAGLGYLSGNIPGAVIQGVGTLANAGIQGYGQGIQEQQTKLQGLYDKLSRANDDYRSMRRPAGLRQAGLQSRYFNQLY